MTRAPRACLDCGRLTHGTRCKGCTRTKGAAKNKRRATLAPPHGAAATLRRTINQTGAWQCAHCHTTQPATQLDVDHITPLQDGGTDTDNNVQALCRSTCHTNKTRTEARTRADRRRRRH